MRIRECRTEIISIPLPQDASIPVHIENICSRNYVHVDSGRRLVPTKLGVVLVHGYQKIDPQLVQPTMRSAIEEQLNLIAKGKADFDLVLRHTLDIFQAKFEFFRSHTEQLDELFEASFSSVAESGRPLSRCGKCQRYLKYIAARPQRMYCGHCNETYSLPQGGSVKLYKEIKCPLDDFELLVFSSPTKSYLVCPYCYNQPPFKGVAKGMGCNQCPHQSCVYAVPHQRVDQCMECDRGTLVLEPYIKTGGPAPKWKISCNSPKCRVMYEGFAGSSDVQSSTERCPQCGASLLTADLSRVAAATVSTGSSKVTGCWECDDVISDLVAPATPEYRHGKGRRGRKRGRGRGNRRKT
jgi:DNA topoisomerase-3